MKSLYHTIEHQSTNSPDRQDAERKNLGAEAGSKFWLTSQRTQNAKTLLTWQVACYPKQL